MKSVFDASSPKLQDIKVPKTFKMLAKGILEEMQRRFSPSEVRALAADKVACPTLRVGCHKQETSIILTSSSDYSRFGDYPRQSRCTRKFDGSLTRRHDCTFP